MWAIRNGEPYGKGVTDDSKYAYARGRRIVKRYLEGYSKPNKFAVQAHNNTGLADIEALYVLKEPGRVDAHPHLGHGCDVRSVGLPQDAEFERRRATDRSGVAGTDGGAPTGDSLRPQSGQQRDGFRCLTGLVEGRRTTANRLAYAVRNREGRRLHSEPRAWRNGGVSFQRLAGHRASAMVRQHPGGSEPCFNWRCGSWTTWSRPRGQAGTRFPTKRMEPVRRPTLRPFTCGRSYRCSGRRPETASTTISRSRTLALPDKPSSASVKQWNQTYSTLAEGAEALASGVGWR